ncbi:MAG: hypothetical protein AAF218_09320 [Pseudomonadota bacterium]
MARILLALLVCFAVAACGAPRASAPSRAAPVKLFATGPIATACQQAGRKAASRAQCGCVQAVADMELSAADQRRGAGFFSDPHGLQEVRQSSQSIAANGRFWAAWKAYGERAKRLCPA